MPILTGCCCFTTLKTGSRAAAIFTILMSIGNFMIDVAILARLSHFKSFAEPQEIYLYIPPGTTVFMAVELLLSVLMLPVGLMLLVGINYGFEGKRMLLVWVVFMSADRFYDCFMGVYLMSWIGGHRFRDVLYPLPESILITVYWVFCDFILLAAILCVTSYWQQLKDELFGKERRVKHYRKFANIRQAALSGNNTPYKSYFSSRSMLTLAPSQTSLGH